MGIMNLIKANWSGRVGQTVGAKWRDKSTIRSYSKPAATNTPAQQTVRTGFAEISSYVALFADQIKSLSALDTKGMSVRNAILKLNHDQIAAGALDVSTLLVSRGGLPNVGGFTASSPSANNAVTASWTPAVGATISAKARVVVIAVSQAHNFVAVGYALNSAGSLSIPATVPATSPIDVHYYLIDYRGSSRVGSPSGYLTYTSS